MRLLQRVTAGLILAAASVTGSWAQQDTFEKNIMTGGPSGTYIQIGRNLSNLGESCGLELTVQESAGSLENFLAVRDRRNTQFGIVQSDVLEYLKTYAADDPAIQRAITGVVIAAPLYNEEIQILAKREIATIEDLAGKRVSVGVEDSGTFLTSSLVLDRSGVNVGERLLLDSQTSLEALLNNDIDAMFYVAGAPTALFQNEQITADRFHLLPLTSDTLKELYTPASIPAGTYDFQDSALDVVAVKAVLMTYDYDASRNLYHSLSCDAVSDYSYLIASKFDELRETGHPKWQNVSLTEIPPGWRIGECVIRGLDAEYSSVCTQKIENPPPAEPEANAIYRERICAAVGC